MHPQTPRPTTAPSIIIIGAGIAGLTTALSLHAAGFTDMHIFEASPTLSTLGVGINIQPSAVLVLRNLGLLPALLNTGIQTKELNYYDRFGNPIISEPRGLDAGYSVPQLSIHRGELQQLLLDAVRERVGRRRVHLDHAFVKFEQDDDFVGGSPGLITAHFARRRDASLEPEIAEMTANMIIGADGFNSTARRLVYPNEGPPKFSGRILWRGCVEREPYLTGASMAWCGHGNQKFIAYPVSSQSAKRGKSMVNWVALLRTREEDDPDTTPPKPDWTKSVPRERFAGKYESWTYGFLDIPDLIESTEKVFEFPMCDRDPVERWSFGRITLLGDAAHPMYPVGSNGATQSIIDAETLANCLLAQPSIEKVPFALQAYQEMRLPPTAKIVLANRSAGPDRVLQMVHDRAPDGFKDIHDVIPKKNLEAIGEAYRTLAGFDVENVNRKAKDSEDAAQRIGIHGASVAAVNGNGIVELR